MIQIRALILVTLLVVTSVCASKGSPFDHRFLAAPTAEDETDTDTKCIQCVIETGYGICTDDDGNNSGPPPNIPKYACCETSTSGTGICNTNNDADN